MPRQPPHILWCELQFTLTSLTNNIMHSLVKTWLPFCFKGHEVLKPNKVQECELKNMRVFRSSKLKGKEKEQTVYLCPICSKDDGLVSPKKKWVSRSFRRQNSQTSRFQHADFSIASNMTFGLNTSRMLPADAHLNCSCTLYTCTSLKPH